MTEIKDDERRQHQRVPYGAWVEDMSNIGQLRFYLTQNLSQGGLLLQAEKPPPQDSNVRLRLVVENEKRAITLEGSVVRISESRDGTKLFAVQFMNLDDEMKKILQEIINEAVSEVREN